MLFIVVFRNPRSSLSLPLLSSFLSFFYQHYSLLSFSLLSLCFYYPHLLAALAICCLCIGGWSCCWWWFVSFLPRQRWPRLDLRWRSCHRCFFVFLVHCVMWLSVVVLFSVVNCGAKTHTTLVASFACAVFCKPVIWSYLGTSLSIVLIRTAEATNVTKKYTGKLSWNDSYLASKYSAVC